MYVATTKLKQCKKHLKAWSRDHFANILRKIKIVKELLWRVEEASASFGNLEEIARLKKELNSLYDKEEKMWQQRSRIQWLKGLIRIQNFFLVQLPIGRGEILLKGCMMGMGCGRKMRKKFQPYCLSITLNSSLPHLFMIWSALWKGFNP